MKYISLIITLLIANSIIWSQELVQNEAKTKVSFKIKNMGSYVDGDFSEIDIKSNFNTKDITNSFLTATIAVNTLDTNNDSRNESLAEKKYFDVANYPNIILKSIAISAVSENTYSLKANLTVKATTKTITIPLKIIENENEITITSDFGIDRRDYNVGKNSWILSDDVIIKVVYVATK